LNLTSERPMKIMGIEDMTLYFKSVETYGKLAGRRQAILEYLKTIQDGVDKIKNRLYPAELLNYEKQRAGKASFDGRLSGLLMLATQRSIDLKEFPNSQKLMALQEQEKLIDFGLANLEQVALVEDIQKRGGGKDLGNAIAQSNRLRSQKASQFAHFQNLFAITKEKGISLSKYPNLVRYGEYLKAFASLDLDEVLGELERVEDKVYASALTKRDVRLIRCMDRYLGLLKTAYQIQMTAKDFRFFKANEADFLTKSYLAFLNRKLADLGYVEDLVSYKELLEQGQQALEAFYESVSQRDSAFIRNAQRIMQQQHQKVAVLISGGYHTQNLKQLFAQKGDSFAVLAPTVTSPTNQKKYEKSLLSVLKRGVKEAPVIELINGRSAKSSGVRLISAVEGHREDLYFGRLRGTPAWMIGSIRPLRRQFFNRRRAGGGADLKLAAARMSQAPDIPTTVGEQRMRGDWRGRDGIVAALKDEFESAMAEALQFIACNETDLDTESVLTMAEQPVGSADRTERGRDIYRVTREWTLSAAGRSIRFFTKNDRFADRTRAENVYGAFAKEQGLTAAACRIRRGPRSVLLADASGRKIFLSEAVPGEDFAAVARKIRSEEDYYAIAREIIRGLAELHAQGIAHADLYPGHICGLDADPSKSRAVFIDFGIGQWVGPRIGPRKRAEVLSGDPVELDLDDLASIFWAQKPARFTSRVERQDWRDWTNRVYDEARLEIAREASEGRRDTEAAPVADESGARTAEKALSIHEVLREHFLGTRTDEVEFDFGITSNKDGKLHAMHIVYFKNSNIDPAEKISMNISATDDSKFSGNLDYCMGQRRLTVNGVHARRAKGKGIYSQIMSLLTKDAVFIHNNWIDHEPTQKLIQEFARSGLSVPHSALAGRSELGAVRKGFVNFTDSAGTRLYSIRLTGDAGEQDQVLGELGDYLREATALENKRRFQGTWHPHDLQVLSRLIETLDGFVARNPDLDGLLLRTHPVLADLRQSNPDWNVRLDDIVANQIRYLKRELDSFPVVRPAASIPASHPGGARVAGVANYYGANADDPDFLMHVWSNATIPEDMDRDQFLDQLELDPAFEGVVVNRSLHRMPENYIAAGSGNYGRIFRNADDKRKVLKVITAQANTNDRDRIQNNIENIIEARILSQIARTSARDAVCVVMEVGVYEDNTFWFEMDSPESSRRLGSVDHIDQFFWDLDERERIQILLRLTERLIEIHRAGYVHQDIYAKNVLVYKEHGQWQAKLIDFGSAQKGADYSATDYAQSLCIDIHCLIRIVNKCLIEPWEEDAQPESSQLTSFKESAEPWRQRLKSIVEAGLVLNVNKPPLALDGEGSLREALEQILSVNSQSAGVGARLAVSIINLDEAQYSPLLVGQKAFLLSLLRGMDDLRGIPGVAVPSEYVLSTDYPADAALRQIHLESIEFAPGNFMLNNQGAIGASSFLFDRTCDVMVLDELGRTTDDRSDIPEKDLVEAFNRILKRHDFHTRVDIATYRDRDGYKLSLAEEIVALYQAAQTPGSSLSDADYLKLNKALLQAVYPRLTENSRRSDIDAHIGQMMERPREPYTYGRGLLAVRSSAAQSNPGLMKSVPYIGMTQAALEELTAKFGEAQAYGYYCRFLRSFGTNIFDIPEANFAQVLAAETDTKTIAGKFERIITNAGYSIPDNSREQLAMAIGAVKRSALSQG
ncbi:MAG: lipopolysaccharide kinase InaA family protein, partial [Candidatus Omnitrophota bacterium]